MPKFLALFLICLLITFAPASLGQQANPRAPAVQKSTPARKSVPPPPERPAEEPTWQEQSQEHPQRTPAAGAQEEHASPQEMRFDMTETAPSVTHHQIRMGGKVLRYTATAGRLPIKNSSGKTEALMFYVAYTLDDADPDQRPLTFAFNGGPGAASIWLHMGALGPRKVVLQKNGFMPPAPYRLEDNQETLLDKTDIVLVMLSEQSSADRLQPRSVKSSGV